MKIIYIIDTDDNSVISTLRGQIDWSNDWIIIPKSSILRIFVISDTGVVTELK